MKKLLLIMPNFFDYPQIIQEELNNMGYQVDYFDDRPSTNGFVKAVIRVKKTFLKAYIQKYFDKIMKVICSKQYDIVFLISGQSLSFSEQMIQEIKMVQSKAVFVLYQWDSLKNFPYIKNMHPFFDKCYSFDKQDVQQHENLQFLPLFYSQRYESLGKAMKQDYDYDFCFVGTAHPKKYKMIKMMSQQLEKVYPRQFIYFFFPSRLVYIYRKFKNKEFQKAHYKEFHYAALNGEQMDELYKKSKCVLDSPQAGQLGLTIRVIEALGAKKKLITTNEDIVNYDFYRPENIYVYNGKIDYNDVFFLSEYKEIENTVYEKYSLRAWLDTMLK